MVVRSLTLLTTCLLSLFGVEALNRWIISMTSALVGNVISWQDARRLWVSVHRRGTSMQNPDSIPSLVMQSSTLHDFAHNVRQH